MELAYVYERDANSPTVQSGRPAAILREFERAGLTVRRCFPLSVRLGGVVYRIKRKLVEFSGKRFLSGRSTHQLKGMARQAEAALRGLSVDFVFCPGTLPIAYLRTSKPVMFSSDATFRSMANYYRQYSGLNPFQVHAAEKAERSALRNSAILAYASEWAAKSAVSDYGVPEERSMVIPSGANIGGENEAFQVHELIAKRPADRVDLLFVGKDWSRKGGAICMETVRLLNERGIQGHLHIVGCVPQVPPECERYVHCHGLLKADVPNERRELERLFQTAHFLFVPSRAEAFGMVFCEGNAFGLPCITAETGGIPTVVKQRVNGVMLPLQAGAADYAREIAALFANREVYHTMAVNSFREFEQRLNWRAWMRTFLPAVESTLAARRGRVAM